MFQLNTDYKSARCPQS